MAKIEFTATRVAEHSCPHGTTQAFIWDSVAPGLGLRVTPRGDKGYIFQSKLNGKTMRINIGKPGTWTIKAAQVEARRLQTIIDKKEDPRVAAADELAAKQDDRNARKAAKDAADAEDAAKLARETITFGQAWAAYLEDRKPRWGDRHYRDHVAKISPGGVQKIRGTRGRGETIAGPLHHFSDLPLAKIDAELVEAWSKKEGAVRPTSARLAWRLLKVFFQWCSEHKTYASLTSSNNPGKTKRSREYLGQVKTKKDNIESAQLKAWFASVQKIGNIVVSAYLRTLLLTGARPGEILVMKWGDINWRWGSITMRDKIEGDRVVPLTPYVEHLLAALPHRDGNEYVFSSAQGTGPIASPNAAHHAACKAAGLDPVTLHGLRRSFASLTVPMDIAGGVSMQIQGHKPTSAREKSYIIWPLDLLKKSHQKIEAQLLEQAGIKFVPVKPGLRAVTTT